nr:hypothetical protein [Nanoarchaeum sp.]
MEEYNFEVYSKFEKDFWYIKSRQDLLERIIKKYFKNKKDLKILDAGCGTGFNFKALSKFGEVHGVDLSNTALEECKKLDYKSLELKDINSLGYENHFDLIVAIELIEHIDNDGETINNFKKYLKEDGILIITTPAFKFLWSKDDELAMHKRRYSKKRLKKIINASGLKIKYLSYRYFLFFLPASLIFLIQKNRKKKKNSLEYTPKWTNKILLNYMKFENWIISKGAKFPIGIGFIAISQKYNQ